MEATDKYVYVITCDELMKVKQELDLFRTCRQKQIFLIRSFLSNDEIFKILRLFQILKFKTKKSIGEH